MEADKWFLKTLNSLVDIKSLHYTLINEINERVYNLSDEYIIALVERFFILEVESKNINNDRHVEWRNYLIEKGKS